MDRVRVLGISYDVWITSACLIEDGRIVAACPEERLNRQKRSNLFPTQAVRFCLDQAGCELSDVDYIAVGWNPAIHANYLNSRYSSTTRWRAEQLYAIPNHVLGLQGADRVTGALQELAADDVRLRIVYVDHQKAHAAAFNLSGFDEAAVLTCDGRGEEETVTMSVGRGNEIEELDRQLYPHSIGMLYGAFTQYLGFRRDSDEWKVMALYSYHVGQDNPYLETVRKMVRLLPDGRFELDLNYFRHYMYDHKTWYSDRLVQELGPPREKDDELEERHYQLAHALQVVAEESLTHLLTDLHSRTGIDKLVIAGGTFMNSVYNGKIVENTPFKEVFIPSCPDDSGVSIGAASWVYHQMLGGERVEVMDHNYYGPGYSDADIKATLDAYKLPYRHLADAPAYAAQQIADGKIIGWFQGRMEFGQRALGNRSILADPRRAEMKDKINASIKYRESFRPFAPAVLDQHTEEYFQVKGSREVPFMERVYMIQPDKTSIIPAVTHVDGSGRLQTVTERHNPRFFRLISEFKKLTGVPVVVNTSFNLNGEPIVCSPTDAVRTFYSCGLDALVVGDYVLEKA